MVIPLSANRDLTPMLSGPYQVTDTLKPHLYFVRILEFRMRTYWFKRMEHPETEKTKDFASETLYPNEVAMSL